MVTKELNEYLPCLASFHLAYRLTEAHSRLIDHRKLPFSWLLNFFGNKSWLRFSRHSKDSQKSLREIVTVTESCLVSKLWKPHCSSFHWNSFRTLKRKFDLSTKSFSCKIRKLRKCEKRVKLKVGVFLFQMQDQRKWWIFTKKQRLQKLFIHLLLMQTALYFPRLIEKRN